MSESILAGAITDFNNRLERQKTFTKKPNKLLRAITRRQNKNMDTRIIVEGSAGIGKSWTALRLAEKVDPFYIDDPLEAIKQRVFFTAEDFMEAIQTQPTRSVLIYDEAGQSFHHREFMTQANIILSKTMIGYRYKQFITILCIPTLNMIDKDARSLSQFLINVYAHGKSEVYKIKVGKFDGIAWPNFLIHKFSTKAPGVKLRHAYEDKKQETQKTFYQDWLNQLKDSKKAKVTNTDLLEAVKANPKHFIKGDAVSLSIPLLTGKLNIGRDRAYSLKAQFESQ